MCARALSCTFLALAAATLPAADPVHSTLPTSALARLADDRLRHAETVTALCYLPDGRLASGSRDGTVRIWDTKTGRRLHELTRSGSAVSALLLTDRGRHLAASFSEDAIRLLDVASGREVRRETVGTHEQITITRDGRYLAMLIADGEVKLLERASNLERLDLPAANRLAFSPDGRTVAHADSVGLVTLYQIVGGQPRGKFTHGSELSHLVYRDDGQRLATADASDDPRVKIWEPGPERPVAEIPGQGPVAFLGQDRVVVRRVSSVGVWSMTKKDWILDLPTPATVMAVSPDGTHLATAGDGPRVRLWNLSDGRPLLTPEVTASEIHRLVPAADGRSVLAIANGETLHWTFDTTRAVKQSHPVQAAAIANDRLALATVNEVRIHDSFAPDRPIPTDASRVIPLPGETRNLALSFDGRLLAVGGADRHVRLFDLRSGAALGALDTDTAPIALAFHPKLHQLALLGRDGFLRLFETAPAEGVTEEMPGQELWKRRVQRGTRGMVAFSPDGRWLAASSSTRLSIVDAATGSETFAIDRHHEDGLFLDAAFSPESRYLAAVSDGAAGAVQVWELATRSRVRRFTTRLGPASHVAFLPDGRRIISAAADGSFTVWDVTGRANQPPPGEKERLAAVERLASLDGAVAADAVWTLAAGGDKSRPLIDDALRRIEATKHRVAKLIVQLDADEYSKREAASKELAALGYDALKALDVAAESSLSETRRRAIEVRSILSRKGIVMPAHEHMGGELQRLRIVQLLQELGR